MKALTFTTRNVVSGTRNDQGEMVLRTLGDVTVTLEGMTRTEIAEWEWLTDELNTRGWDEAQFRLTVQGWKVTHGGETVGLLFQGAGTRTHVEVFDPADGEFYFEGLATGTTRGLRHGAAMIVNARQHYGHGLPVDPEPEVFAPRTRKDPRLPDNTPVRYTGTFAASFGDVGIHDFTVRYCDCDELACRGYELHTSGVYEPIALHVGLDSVEPLELAAA